MHRSFQSKAIHHAKLSIHDNTGCANLGLLHSELTAVVSKGFRLFVEKFWEYPHFEILVAVQGVVWTVHKN